MTKEKLINLKEELKKIKEGYEIIPFEEYYEKNKQEEHEIIPFEEYYERKINYPVRRNFKRAGLKKGIIAAAVAVCVGISSMPTIPVGQNIITVVEAKSKKKKDKKKPVFKNFGKTKIKVEKGKKVKIPKVSAKDNKDGNVTKKIKLTVVCKKNKKRIKSVEKNILKGKSVKFNTDGLHELTYTVKDKAGNKATKKRYIEVVDPKKKTTEKVTTETPTTERVTTQEKTTERVTTETTTEKPTTQNPTVEKPTMPDMSEYGTIEKVTVNGINYNILKVTDNDKYYDEIFGARQAGTASCDKILAYEIGYDESICDYSKNHKYLEFFGNLKIVDEYGVDCSNTIFIVESSGINRLSYVDSKGNFRTIFSCRLSTYEYFKELGNYTYIDYENKIVISGEIFGEEYLLNTLPPKKYIFENI